MFSGALKAGKGSVGGGSTTVNPPFNTVTTLLHADGSNGQINYPLTDTSGSSPALTLSGTATTGVTPFMQGSFSPFKSAYSVDCRASTAPIFTTLWNANFAPSGNGYYTIECWVYPYSTGTIKTIMDVSEGGGAGRFALRLNATNKVEVARGATLTTLYASTGTVALNTWSHIAFQFDGTTNSKIFINGVQDSTSTAITSWTSTTGNLYFCCQGTTSPSNYFDGLISQLRLVKYVQVYTSPFTPPQYALQKTQSAGTNISAISGTQTSLLFFVRPYFVDASYWATDYIFYRGNSLANTSTYPWFVAQSPIANATIDDPTNVQAWSASAFGGSYGNVRTMSNQLVTSDSTKLALGDSTVSGATDFTIEFWCYLTTSGVRQDYIDLNHSNVNARIDIYVHPTTFCMQVFAAASDYFTQTTLAKDVALIGTWSHIALTRSGTTTSLFWNGRRIATSTVAINAGTVAVNCQVSGQDGSITGLIGGTRIVKGIAVYSAAASSYTIPTAPFAGGTYPTATAMLINASTNAPMVDYSMNQTFFNGSSVPSVSTAQFKYGTASLNTASAFLPSQSNVLSNSSVTFGTGDFTVEGWFYANAGTSNRGIFQIAFTPAGNGAGQTGLALAYYTATNLRLFYGAASAAVGTSSKVTTATWTHFAVVRSGTGASNLKVYINGVADTALTVTDSYDYPISYLAIGTYSTSLTWTGYIDEFRVSKYAVYTDNFTVPNTAYANT